MFTTMYTHIYDEILNISTGNIYIYIYTVLMHFFEKLTLKRSVMTHTSVRENKAKYEVKSKKVAYQLTFKVFMFTAQPYCVPNTIYGMMETPKLKVCLNFRVVGKLVCGCRYQIFLLQCLHML